MAITAYGGMTEGIKNFLNIQKAGQDMDYTQQQMEVNKQKIAIGDMQLKEAQRAQEMDNTFIPLSSLQKGFELFPNYAGGLLQMGRDMNIIKEVGGQEGVLVGDFKHLNKMLGQVEEYKDKSLEWVSGDLTNLRKNLEGKLAETKSDKDKEPIQKQLAEVTKQQENTFNDMYKRKIKMEQLEKDMTPASIQKFYTGGTAADLVPIKLVEETIKLQKKEEPNLQQKGILKDGRAVAFDPRRGIDVVDGVEKYNKKTMGGIITPAVSQTFLINKQDMKENEFNNWSPKNQNILFKRVLLGADPRKIFGFGQSATKNLSQFQQGYLNYLDASGVGAEGAEFTGAEVGSLKAAMTQTEKRYALVSGYVNEIKENTNLIKRLKKEVGKDYGKISNTAINSLKGIIGSGDLQKLKLAVISTSNLLAKVESGSLGIAEVSVSQAQQMKSIHNINLSIEDFEKVLNTGVELGDRNLKALELVKKTQKETFKNIGSKEKEAPKKEEKKSAVPQKNRVKMPKEKIEEYKRQAKEAIKNGVAESKVEEEFKRITGEDY